jgi:DNA repair exonuclease SbcCD nuclease subunit
MALYICGDLHFTNSHEWDNICFTRFIDYFESLSIEANSSLFLLGDVTDKKLNDSQTLDFVTRFFSIALKKFKKIYVIGGNHDMYEDNFKNIHYTTQYLKYLDPEKIVLIYNEDILDIDGLKIMVLPHKKVTAAGIDEYYNSELSNDFYSTQVDLILGHLSIYDEKMPIAGGLDLDKFNYKKAYFGHVHSRVGTHADKYTGSVMPFKKSENDTTLPRCIAKITKDSIEEIEIPIFKRFETIDISKELPKYKKDSNPTIIYDFINCNDETAESLRKDYFIRYEKDVLDIVESDTEEESTIVEQIFSNFYEAYTKMCQDLDIHPRRSVNSLIKSLLLEDD